MDWNAALATADAAVASTFDRTSATMVPRKVGMDVNRAPVADPDRASFVRLVSIERGPTAFPVSERPSGDPASQRQPVQYEAVMTATVVDWPWLPARGDRIEEATHAWTVGAVQNDGTGRPAFFLNRAG